MIRHFLTGEELSGNELEGLLARAGELKGARGQGNAKVLKGKSIALLFERPSTRTRISFEVAIYELGGHAVVLREGELQLSRGESLRDTATVLSKYVDALAVRTGSHQALAELAEYSQVPIINALTSLHHPCQALADLQTLKERFGELAGLRLAYVGDGNNVAHSLLLTGPRLGVEVACATPPELTPSGEVIERARSYGGAKIELCQEPAQAVVGAHAVYTDVWVSMGDEQEASSRRDLLKPYQLNQELLGQARPGAIALHCLPAHPGEEITAEVLYSERSAVWDQAENRLHTQKALLELLLT